MDFRREQILALASINANDIIRNLLPIFTQFCMRPSDVVGLVFFSEREKVEVDVRFQ